MADEFRRIAIVNRGEAAARLIHAVRERNLERGTDLRTIAFHTHAERRALFVREADEGVCLDDTGPSSRGGRSPYLDYDVLADALGRSGADAVWPGWGFVAEHAEFAEMCDAMGVKFIGPDAAVIRRLGDKIASKLLAEQAGVPVAPWSRGPVGSIEEAYAHAGRIGYPLVIKATAGGGGRGIRLVMSAADLPAAFDSARAEAGRSFGDPTVFLERRVVAARHVEVQVIADDFGTVWSVGVRDCSLQRRNQKVIEESRSTALDAAQEDELRSAAERLCALAGYRNAGTVEFLYQPEERLLAFLEVNTRLQVEHPVTEMVTGLDLVKLQLHVALGGRLQGSPPPTSGHAIEARLNAEDPQRDFAPAPGAVALFKLPTGPGIRVDTGVAEGDDISPEYDSMIAKVIAWGRDRDEARARLRRALSDLTVVIRGGVTNKSFLLDVLGRPEVAAGVADTSWLDRLSPGEVKSWAQHADVALAVAAIDAYDGEAAIERSRFLASASRGRPQITRDLGQIVELQHDGQSYRVRVARAGAGGWYRLEADGRVLDVVVERLTRFASRLTMGRASHKVVSLVNGTDHVVEIDGSLHRLSRDDGGVVRAPAASVVVRVAVEPGDVVEGGARLVVVESMKMEVTITAPMAGRVTDVLVASNVQVEAGAPLIRLEPLAVSENTGLANGTRVAFPEQPPPMGDDRRSGGPQWLEGLRSFIAGFDLSVGEAHHLLDVYEGDRDLVSDEDGTLLRCELAVLATFADVVALTRNRREGEDEGDEAHSPRERFRTYLRSLDIEREGLPERFRVALLCALRHYHVSDLARTPELEEALYRIFRAQQAAPAQVPVIVRMLEGIGRRLDDGLTPSPDVELRETLDALILATQRRFPVVGNLARSLRYRAYDRRMIEQAKEAFRADARDQLAHLAAHPDSPDRAERLEMLVRSPHSLLPLLVDRLGDLDAREPMLELVTRRYYRIRELRHLRAVEISGHQLLTAEYENRGRLVRIVAARASAARFADVSAVAAGFAAELPAAGEVVVDLYVATDEAVDDPDVHAATVGAILDGAGFGQSVRRVAVATCQRGTASVHQFTFRQTPEGLVEVPVVRGLHPMIRGRTHLWRLANFHLRRLPSAQDVYLFNCIAKDNPADERLIALAEVRDLTPVRDASGRVTELPELEQVLGACLDSLRAAQVDGGARLSWNRVQLYIWPPVETPVDELLAVSSRMAPITEGLGLDQVVLQARIPQAGTGELTEVVVRLGSQPGTGLTVRLGPAPTEPLRTMDAYTQRVIAAQRRGAPYPYELVPLLARPGGSFVEYDLDDDGALVPVVRPPGGNTAGVVIGLVRTPTARHPEGMVRVAILGDPTKALGSIAEPECRRLLAAIDLAAAWECPIEWFALSAGAKIAMNSGSENLDWVGRVLRRLVEFTQARGEVNVIVTGINVGAQPYWNAEATMLMHTRGILVMTPDSAMVLTGKQALDYAGGVSAEDNLGLGGYERIMGPNGQAQFFAADVAGACDILFAHYEHAYLARGERFGRRALTTDPIERDIRHDRHLVDGVGFTSVGDIFSRHTNPDRKKPFDIRTLMRATIDRDHPPLERWSGMADAGTAVVFEAHLGGYPVTLIGVESRPLPRHGAIPADGPDQWSAGTLFPLSSKKVARAINASSANRPVVILANLSGFDGSSESLRKLQLEYGAEIGRAVVNFDGPIVLCVVSRYHGGAFVVFSSTLNDQMEVLAVEGSFASVIGGAAAAAVVFSGDVNARVQADPRVQELGSRVARASGADRATLRSELAEVTDAVRLEKLGEVAAEFDAVHSVERALEVGSVHRVIAADALRPSLIDAVERGLRGALDRC